MRFAEQKTPTTQNGNANVGCSPGERATGAGPSW